MKIVILGTAYPYRGGLAAFNERLAMEYTRQGHDVEIYTFTLQYPSLLFPGKSQYSDSPAPQTLKIVRRVNSCNPFNWIRVGHEIAEKRPDLLITKYWLPFMAPCLGTILRRVRRNGHTRVAAILDNVIPHEHRIGDKLFSRYFVGSTDGFVAMSQSVLDDLSLFDATKPRRLCLHPLYDHYGTPMPRETALQLLGLPTEPRYILFFGFIRRYKGLDLLFDAMASPLIKDKNVKLLVAGEYYEDAQPYKDQIARLGLGDRIVMKTDFVPDSEVARYFSAADIVALPYRSATQSGVTQVAFHFDRPMLVTNVGGLGEIVAHQRMGYVVDSDPDAIAHAIDDFFTNSRKDDFAAAVHEEKKKYSWSNMTQAVEQVSGGKS